MDISGVHLALPAVDSQAGLNMRHELPEVN